jgi:hypothetical protein
VNYKDAVPLAVQKAAPYTHFSSKRLQGFCFEAPAPGDVDQAMQTDADALSARRAIVFSIQVAS